MFGIAITLVLYVHELYGIKKCHCLIELGKEIEASRLGFDGQFKTGPRGILADLVNEPFATGVICAALCQQLTKAENEQNTLEKAKHDIEENTAHRNKAVHG